MINKRTMLPFQSSTEGRGFDIVGFKIFTVSSVVQSELLIKVERNCLTARSRSTKRMFSIGWNSHGISLLQFVCYIFQSQILRTIDAIKRFDFKTKTLAGISKQSSSWEIFIPLPRSIILKSSQLIFWIYGYCLVHQKFIMYVFWNCIPHIPHTNNYVDI